MAKRKWQQNSTQKVQLNSTESKGITMQQQQQQQQQMKQQPTQTVMGYKVSKRHQVCVNLYVHVCVQD